MEGRVPVKCYGVLRRESPQTPLDEVVLQIRNIGYAILESGYSAAELDVLSAEFEKIRKVYDKKYGKFGLPELDEHNTIRAPLLQSRAFLRLALNKNLHVVLENLIGGQYILNQQNGIINPPQATYNQGAWHRDLPYQHFVCSTPLAVNALFCLDDFTTLNGATYVLPASHKISTFPSPVYIEKNALQVEAKRGQFIMLDCMLFHAGGANTTKNSRRAINHVYTIPYFKQQINIPRNLSAEELSDHQRQLLGFKSVEADSVQAFLANRRIGAG